MDQPKISLSFSKKIEKKNLQTSALQSSNITEASNLSQKHSISSFDKKTSQIILKKEDSLIIPLINSKRADLVKNLNISSKNVQVNIKPTENGGDKPPPSLDEQAAAAILEESKLKQNASHNDKNTIKLEYSDSLDSEGLDQLGSISTLDDYEKVSIESYGAALLRGMGWSKSLGVGKNNKRVVDIVEPTSKVLGVTVEKVNQTEGTTTEEEAVELKNGCYVLIHSGRNKGTYGTVQSIDEDHMLVKPARDSKILREVEANVRAVTGKEFKEFSRVINKDMYDQYKAEELKKKDEEKKKHRIEDVRKNRNKRENEVDDKRSDYRKSEIGSKRSRDKSDLDKDREDENIRHDSYSSKERKRRDKDYKKYSPEVEKITHKKEPMHESQQRTSRADDKEGTSEQHYHKTVMKVNNCNNESYKKEYSKKIDVNPTPPPIPWARENLRVRIIDTKYKGGNYHKEKVIVRSVDTMESCSCIADDGKMLWDVKLSNLETVIPKHSSSLVLILNGIHKGKKGKIFELHKEKEKATVQLLSDSSVILKLLYDDICEYVDR